MHLCGLMHQVIIWVGVNVYDESFSVHIFNIHITLLSSGVYKSDGGYDLYIDIKEVPELSDYKVRSWWLLLFVIL